MIYYQYILCMCMAMHIFLWPTKHLNIKKRIKEKYKKKAISIDAKMKFSFYSKTLS